jgi:pimeloyl-ACP methyl ester carboxylesterase
MEVPCEWPVASRTIQPDGPIREADVELGSGVRLHYAEAGDSRGAPLVLLHGYTDSWRSFGLVLPLLARTRRILAPDLRGHGDSSAPAGDYGIARLARDVAEFMTRLELGPSTLVGHSLGSFVARRVALDDPRRIDRLILVGTAGAADNAVVRALREEVSRFGETIPAAFVEEFQASCVHRREAVPEWFFASCVAASRQTRPHVWRAALDGLLAEDQSGRLGAIAHPSLIVGGRHDTVFSVAEQEAAAEAMASTRLRLYRHAGHSPHWEEPGRFAEDVEDFLDQAGRPVAAAGLPGSA